MTNARSARAWIVARARRRRGRRPFRRRLDAARQGRRIRHRGRRACSASGTGSAGAIRSGRASACRSPSRSAPKRSSNSCTAATRSTAISARRRSSGTFPLLMGLLSVWNRNVLGHAAQAVIPYDQRLVALSRLSPAIADGEQRQERAPRRLAGRRGDRARSIWGEPGTNGQHAFFQLLHQGTEIVPIDFLVAATPTNADAHHHELLVANCFAQGEALMRGRTPRRGRGDHSAPGRERRGGRAARPAQDLPGQPADLDASSTPSSTPRMLGRLIALYEHKVFVEAAIWDINPFDQWGVELGKELASRLAPIVADPNADLSALDALDGGADRACAEAAGVDAGPSQTPRFSLSRRWLERRSGSSRCAWPRRRSHPAGLDRARYWLSPACPTR